VTTDQAPFTWRELEFGWSWHRKAHVAKLDVGGREHWIYVKDDGYYVAWVEWSGGYTVPQRTPERIAALEGARVELLDVARRYHEDLLARLG